VTTSITPSLDPSLDIAPVRPTPWAKPGVGKARASTPGGGTVHVRLLGPVDVIVRGDPYPVAGLRRKSLLAILALQPGKVVSSSRLIDLIWGDEPPATAVNTLQQHVSYLRAALHQRSAIVAQAPGYVLDVPPDAIDLTQAVRLIGQVGPGSDHARTAAALRRALDLWQGPSLVDVTDVAWLSDQARRLDELRLDAVERLAEARLALGEHGPLVAELEDIAGRYPNREHLHELLMLALYRSGRQADALAAYQRVRGALASELGIDPGPALRGLEVAILRQDPDLDLSAPARSATPVVVARTSPSAPVLLERESALSNLEEYAAQARGGEGRVVLVAGEAGVGKSTLVERLRADLPDARWSWGACDGLFTPRPLEPLFDLADQLGGELADLCRAGAVREELFRALLHQISSPETLDVVVIEDIHWADDATLDLLRYLGRRLRHVPVLLIATYRDDALAAADPLRVALGDLVSLRHTRRIELAPLSAQAVAVLAVDTPLAVTELHRLTGGNPFYLAEVLRGGIDQVPASARDAVLARAARLSDGARDLLDVAALTGTRIEARLLESVAGCGPAALDELVASGLLAGDGAGVRFRHEIARLAVAQAVPTYRARATHQLVLAALRTIGCTDDARLAFHAEAAGDGAAVLRHAAAAAGQAARLASHREAVAQFERALRFAEHADATTVADLYQGFADAVSMLDRWAEAETAMQRALTLWRETGDRLREGDALRRLSRIRWNLCRGREAVAAIETAVATLEPLGRTVELAWAYATFANQRMLYSDHDAAIALARRAQELAGSLDATDVLSDALDTEAVSLAAKDQDWLGLLRRALELARVGGHHDQVGRAYTNLCSLHADRREFAEVQWYLAEAVAYCDEHDLTTYVTCLRGEQANLLERTGHWDEASALSRELLAHAGPSPASRLGTLIRLGAMGARRGEPDVWGYLDEAAATADETGEPQQQVPVRLVRAEAHWLAGRLDEARREAELADDVCANGDAWQRGAVAVWLRRTGSTRPARGLVAEPYRLLLGGEPVRAAQVWTRLGCPYEAALALAAAPDQAARAEALSLLTNLGAVAARTRTAR
jgi:DNA-binding SARP family transcriptional activator